MSHLKVLPRLQGSLIPPALSSPSHCPTHCRVIPPTHPSCLPLGCTPHSQVLFFGACLNISGLLVGCLCEIRCFPGREPLGLTGLGLTVDKQLLHFPHSHPVSGSFLPENKLLISSKVCWHIPCHRHNMCFNPW